MHMVPMVDTLINIINDVCLLEDELKDSVQNWAHQVQVMVKWCLDNADILYLPLPQFLVVGIMEVNSMDLDAPPPNLVVASYPQVDTIRSISRSRYYLDRVILFNINFYM